MGRGRHESDQRALPDAQGPRRLPHGPRPHLRTHVLDGLESAYEAAVPLGTFGEDCAAKYNFTREAQDAFANRLGANAPRRPRVRRLAAEITAVTVKDRAGERVIAIDEGPSRSADKIPTLKPAFKKDGLITAAPLVHQRRCRGAGDEEGDGHKMVPRPSRRIVGMPRMRRNRTGSPPLPSARRRSCSPRPLEASDVDLWK